MRAIQHFQRYHSLRLYSSLPIHKSVTSLSEPDYDITCPIYLDTFGNKMTYFGELKKLSHYIDTSNQIFAYHPKENIYEYIAYWDKYTQLPITEEIQLYKHTPHSKNNFYDFCHGR